MNFVNEDEVNMYSEDCQDEFNDSHRTATSPKTITLETTNLVVNISATPEPQKCNMNVTRTQLQSVKNKLFDKILAFNSYIMDEILSLKIKLKFTTLN